MNNIELNVGQLLSREEAKAINAGSGGGKCVIETCSGGILVLVNYTCQTAYECAYFAEQEGITCVQSLSCEG